MKGVLIKDLTVSLLAIMMCMGFYLSGWIILSGKVETSDPNKLMLINTTLNYMNGLAMMAAGYFFGSSKNSADKDKTIANMATGEKDVA